MNDDRDSHLPLITLVMEHWELCLATVVCCIGLAGLFFLIAPRKYQSEMKLLVENKRADLVITPGKTATDTERSDLNETEVNSEIELLRSRDILESVVRDTKLYRPFEAGTTATPTALDVAKAVVRLDRDLNISSVRKSNIISVSYKAANPNLAAAVLKDLKDRYLNAHLAVHSAPETYKFFLDESAKYRNQLSVAEDALTHFHRKTQIFSMPQQTTAVVGRLEDIKAQIKDLGVQISEAEARLAENQRQLGATSDRLVTQVKEVANPVAVQQLKTLLTTLQNRRIELVAKFKPTERSVVELDRQIHNTQQALAEMQTDKLSEHTTDVNAIHQNLVAERIKAEIDLEGLKTRKEGLVRNVGEYLSRLDSLDQNASELQDLEEAEKQADDNYILYSRRVEEARMAEALDNQKFANVAVIETPVSSPIPVSPRLTRTLAGGAILGIFLAALLAFTLGGKNQPLPPRTAVSPEFAKGQVFSAHAGD